MFWANCVSRRKHGSTWMDTLIIKTIEDGVLKTHMRCTKILRIWQGWCSVHSVSKKKSCRTFFFEETSIAENYQNLWFNLLLCWTRKKGECGLQQDGPTAHVAKNLAFLQHVGLGLRLLRSANLAPWYFSVWIYWTQFTAIRQVAWRTWNIILNRLL